MFTAYLIVTVLAAAANIFSASCDFVRYKQVSIAMVKAGVAESWMTTLGILHRPLARTRLLVRPGERVLSTGRGRASVAPCHLIKRPVDVNQIASFVEEGVPSGGDLRGPEIGLIRDGKVGQASVYSFFV